MKIDILCIDLQVKLFEYISDIEINAFLIGQSGEHVSVGTILNIKKQGLGGDMIGRGQGWYLGQVGIFGEQHFVTVNVPVDEKGVGVGGGEHVGDPRVPDEAGDFGGVLPRGEFVLGLPQVEQLHGLVLAAGQQKGLAVLQRRPPDPVHVVVVPVDRHGLLYIFSKIKY